MTEEIVFSRPFIPDDAYRSIKDALSKQVQQGDGEYSISVQDWINSHYYDYRAFLTPSCTAALELSLMLINLSPGDEVIISSFTFTSAATAVTKFYAKPIFCDIDPETGCIDAEKVEQLISHSTKAIIWVNYGGLLPNVDKLLSLSKKYSLRLIEDGAHNFGSELQDGRMSHGDFVTFSFHATKNIQCGEGGALLVKDPNLWERAQVMRDKGTNRSDFARGKTSKYQWIDRGGSFVLAEVNSAILLSQITHTEFIQSQRRQVVTQYYSSLKELEMFGWKTFQDLDYAAHVFALVAPNNSSRERLKLSLRQNRVHAVSHYEDLSSSPGGRRYSSNSQVCANSMNLASTLLRLPLYVGMNENLVKRVTEIVIRFMRQEN